MLYLIKTPSLIQKLFSNLTWSFSSSKKEIYITFDDGPTPEITEWTLTVLKEFKAKATFFCIGKNTIKHPEIHQQILANGHTIGNHTYNHLNGWKTSVKQYFQNIQPTEELFKKLNKNKKPSSKLFRPPYGKIKRKQSKLLIKEGYRVVMWDVLSGDFDQSITPEKCLQNVLKNTRNGSIIIFHDSVKASKNMKYALPKVLEHFSNKGFEFKEIT